MRTIVHFHFSAIALALVLSANFAGAEAVQPSRPLITTAINDADRVTLAGNTRPEANARNDRGRVADNFPLDHMQLQLQRPAQQEKALQQYIAQLHQPTSANYHQWLTAQQLGERYGLAKSDLQAITAWLQTHGFKVNVVYASGMLIDFSGTAGQVREAFQTEIHNLEVEGEHHISNMSDPKIPAALAPAVAGIVSLNDFKPHAMYRPKAQYTVPDGNYTYYLVVPADLATIYNLNPLFSDGVTGKGQTVVVLEDTNIKPVDFDAFRIYLGLNGYHAGNLQITHPASSGTNNCNNPGINGDSDEASLDAEWASAAAPDATIEMASCADTTTFGGLIALQNLLNASSTPPSIVSMSYGLCEAITGLSLKQAFNSAFQQAVSEGVTVFVSSGDADAAGCDRNHPAFHGIGITGWGETPYNVSVGGTDYGDTYLGENTTYWSSTNGPYYGSALSYIPEIPWNDSCASELISTAEGYPAPYTLDGFCNSAIGKEYYLASVGGSGGPSECATGVPSEGGIISGTCQGYAKPSWQSVFGNPSDGVRDIPDVSLFAANGVWGHYYPFCDTVGGGTCSGAPDTWYGGGGTSFSSPIMAGIQALVNQKNGSRQGNANVAYYALADAEYGSAGNSSCNSTLGNATASTCVFYDVTLGDNDTDCTNRVGTAPDCFLPSGQYGVLSTSSSAYLPAYAATSGWDFSTGIGTVNAANLVNQWWTVAPKAPTDK
jgi:subtilase family serine protease